MPLATLANTINEQSSISIGLLVTVGGGMLGIGAFVARELMGIRKALAGIVGDVKSLRVDLAKLEADQWSKADASEWALRARILNPDVRLPDPRNPQNIIGEMHE